MGWRGIVGDAFRSVMRPLVARMVGTRKVIDQAAVVLVQNPETARKIGRTQDAIMLPNALAAPASIPALPVAAGSTRSRRLVTAGRLLGWKGTVLAIAAMEHVEDPDAVLEIYGEGPQLSRLQRFAGERGLVDRVAFKGLVARDELLQAIASSAALVHPSLHEEAGFVISEALALGTPVVCLDRGGPPVLARAWPSVPSRVIPPTTAKQTAAAIGRAINEIAGQAGGAGASPDPSFTEGLLAAYAAAASSRQ
jgi:glycosyltransferase involved in cell wall biosynthesis